MSDPILSIRSVSKEFRVGKSLVQVVSLMAASTGVPVAGNILLGKGDPNAGTSPSKISEDI